MTRRIHTEPRSVGLARLLLAGFLNVAPSSVPEWRLSSQPEPAVTLVVGAPVSAIPERHGTPR